MVRKKILTVFFVVLLALQLLPVKQVISYFFSSTSATEELADTHKFSPKKFIEEDKCVPEFQYSSALLTFINSKLFHPFDEKIPLTHSSEIQTPPPNKA